MPSRATKPNRLATEKSPYLLQHAYNPVDWFAWGEEAFEKSRREEKPIFLSIGYSTCHWCHVMEHESFEDNSVAELMNAHFVCIKVDREERPDVDKVYMSAVQAMTGSGGWPLSVFLTPSLKPFYGGTYFPPRDMQGRPGLPTVLKRIHEVWSEEREKIVESGDRLISLLRQERGEARRSDTIDESLSKKTYHQLAAQYDPKYGGFGGRMKFPRPVVLNFLMRFFARTKEGEALTMALATLKAMAAGGMYDHIGGGFHRYSVDAQWRVPHFEKMLYDQAQLVNVYLDAYQITHDELYARIARETLEYVLRDMTDAGGGFYSAEDADSPEPENPSHASEGAFYIWTKDEVERVLGRGDARVFAHHYSVDEHGNALSDPQGEFKGKNILFTPFSIHQSAEFLSMSDSELSAILARSKKKIFEKRNERPRPLRDDKIIVAWNGLMISAFARASRILHEPRYREAAIKGGEFVFRTMYDAAKRVLIRRYRQGEVRFEAHLDDHAFLVQSFLDLYEATFEIEWLKKATELHGVSVALFWDSAEGGFFDFSGKDDSILLRTKEAYDGAEPAGNSVAVSNILRLAQIADDGVMKKQAEATLRYFGALLGESPSAMPLIVAALDSWSATPEQIVLAGHKDDDRTNAFLQEIYRHFLPDTILLLADGGAGQEYLTERLPFMRSMRPIDNKTTVYVCENYACKLPATDLPTFSSFLPA